MAGAEWGGLSDEALVGEEGRVRAAGSGDDPSDSYFCSVSNIHSLLSPDA